MKILKVMAVAGIALGSQLAGSPAGAEPAKLRCVQISDDNDAVGGRARAYNGCDTSVKVKIVINNDVDCAWRTVAKGDATYCPYGSFWGELDKVQIKYKGKDYVNKH